MWDDFLDLMHGVSGRGLRILNFAIASAIVFPILATIAGLGYGWYRVVHIIFAAVFVLLANGLQLKFPAHKYWLSGIGLSAALIMLLGATAKTMGIVLGFSLSLAALVVIGVTFSGAILIYAGTIAIGPGETVLGAEAKAASTLRNIVGVAAWEWVVGFYVLAFGLHISWDLGMLALFAGIICALGTWGWGLGGMMGRVTAFYSAVLALLIITGILFSRVAEAQGFWNTSVWSFLQPFAVASVPFLLWASMVWLRRARITRIAFAFVALALIVRAILVNMPEQVADATVGRTIMNVVRVSIPENTKTADDSLDAMRSVIAEWERLRIVSRINAANNRSSLEAAQAELDDWKEYYRGESWMKQAREGAEWSARQIKK